ncbi:unnamed protein product, partial [Closterium sp. NIES-53]
DHFLSLDPTSLTVDLLEQHLLAAKTSALAVGAAHGTPRTPFFEGCSPSPLAPSYASAATADVLSTEDVGAASASVKRHNSKGKGGRGGGGGSRAGGGGSSGGNGGSGGGGSGGSGGGSGGVGGGGRGSGGSGGSGSGGSGGSRNGAQRGGSGGDQRQRQQRRSETPVSCPYVIRTGDRTGQTCGKAHTQHCCFSRLNDAWRAEFGDEVERPHWAELLRSGVAIFDLDYDAILSAMYALSASAEGDCYRCVPLDPGIDVVALGASESVLPGTVPAQAMHTFTLDSGASRCFFCDSTTLTPLPAPVPVRLADPSGGPVVAHSSTFLPCPAVPSGSLSGLHLPWFSTNLVSTASLQDVMVTTTTPGGVRIRSGSSPLLVSPPVALDSPVAPPPWSPLPATPSWHALPPPCFWSSQVSASPPALACPALPSLRRGAAACRSSLLLVSPDDCSPADSPHGRGQVVDVLISWIRAVRLQLRERFSADLPVLSLHSDRGGEFSSDLLRDFCCGEGILQSFTLLDSPQKNGIAERRIGLVMEFYHPTSRRVFPSQDVTFDKSVPFYRLFPYLSAPPPPPPLFLTPGPPPVDPLPPQGPAPLGVSQIDPLPGTAPVEGAGSGGAEPGGEEPGSAEPAGVELGGAEPEGVEPGGVQSEGAEFGGAEPQGAASFGGPAGASLRLSPQQLREWLVWRALLWHGATGDGGAGAAGAGGAGVTAGAGGTGGTAATGPGGARPRGIGAAGTGVVGGAGAGDPTELGDAGAGGSGAVGTGDGGARAGGTGARGAGAGGAGVGGTGAGGAGAGGAGAVDPGGTVLLRPYFVPLLQQVLGVPSSTSLTPPLMCPPPNQSQLPLQSASPLPAPSPYTEQSSGLTQHCEPASRPVSPNRIARSVPRSRPLLVPGTHTMALRPSPVPLHVPLPAPPESSLPAVPDPESAAASALVGELLDFAAACRLDYAVALVAESTSVTPPSVGGECALGTDVLEDRQEDFECLAAAVPRFASMLLAPEGDLDAPDIPTPRSYAEAITGPLSSQWQAAMDAEMASWKSTGTYVDEVPPPGANMVDGMWIFRVKRPPGSPPAFKAHYVARGFSQRQRFDYFQTFSPTPKMTNLRVLLHVAAQRDYELHSLDFITAFLQGSLHEEIWLRRPRGFTGSFPAGTQWSLRRSVYGLCQAPREWHDTLRTTLATLGFAPSTADLTLFLRTDTSLPLFYVLVYVDDLFFATADIEALTLVKSELQKRHTCTDVGELCSYLGLQITWDRARCTITLTQSHMVHQVLQRFDFQFSSPLPTPLSTNHSLSAPPSDESVEPNGPYLELVGCLMYLMTCTRPDLAYRLSLLARYVALGRHQKLSSPVTQTLLGSSCEAEIYAGAMAAQELRWLTYLLTDLGEQPRSPPQRGQLRLAYVATRANIADIFTKALPPGDHQRFSTMLGLEFCRGEGILQSFTLSDSPQQNGIAERRIGLVMEVARTSMIHVAAPHFLWPFAVRYVAHQLNLWPRVSLLESSPTLRCTGKVGDASVFRVWGSRAFVRDTSADKLSAHAIPCVFLGFSLDAPGWQFYHPTSRRVFRSQDVTFDKSVPFYCLFPYLSTPPPPPPLFLTPCPPPVDPLPPQSLAPSGVSQIEPLPGTAPAEVAVGSGAAPGAASGGAASGGAGPGVWGAEERGSTSSGGPASAPPRLSPRPEPLSPQQLRKWFAQRTRLRSGAAGVGVSAAGDTGAGGAGVTAGAGGTGAGDPTEPGAGKAGAGGAGAVGAGAGGTGAGGAGARGAGAVDSGAGAGGTVRPRPYFVPLLQQVLGVLSSPDQSQSPLQPASPLPAPSPYTEQTGGLTERREPVSRPASPVRISRRVPRPRPPPVPGTHAMALHPSSVPLRLPLPSPPESSLPALPDSESDRARAASPTVSRLLATVVTDHSFESTIASALVAERVDFAAACRLDYATALVAESESASPSSVEGVCALGMDVLEDRQEEFECLAAAVPRFTSMLLAPEGDPDAPDIPTPRSYAEAITGTYVDALPPSRANIVDGMWIFRVKRPPDSPPAFKARYVARGFSQRQGVDYFHTFSPTPKMTTLWVLLHVAAQRDYESDLLGFSTAFLQGSLHEEIWLGRPPGFTGTTLVALRFAPSTADPSLFLRTDTSLPPFYVLQRFRFQFSSQQPTPLSTGHSLSAPPLDESVEPSGPYPELVGCLIYLMTCTRPDLAYPLSLLARYVALGRHRKKRGQLRLAYVATRANTADIFTKALPLGDH